MRLRYWLVLLALCVPTALLAQNPLPNFQGFCENGNVKPKTQGIASSYPFQASYPHCIITVYTHGTTSPLPVLYADSQGLTPLANPFTSSNTGWYQFYAASGRYDVQESDCTPTTCNLPIPVTLPDIQLNVGGGGTASPCGVLNDVQINSPLGSFGCDTGIFQENPLIHTLYDTIINAYQQVQVSDPTHTGVVDIGHSDGTNVDFHLNISAANLAESYGFDFPPNDPTADGQSIQANGGSPVVDPDGVTRWHTVWRSGGSVSAENRAYLFNNIACNDPSSCSDIPFTPVPWTQNHAFMDAPTNTDGLGFLSNTANWNASEAQLTHSVTLPAVTNVGDPLVVIFQSGTSISGIADTCGNTFIHISPSGWDIWRVAHAVACTTLDTITVTLTGNDGAMMMAGEVINGGDLDTSLEGSSCTGSGPYTVTGDSITTTTADILVALVQAHDVGGGAYDQFYPTTTFTIETQLAALVGGLGTTRSMALGWQTAPTVGSNNVSFGGNVLAGGVWVCPDIYTMAFKPATAGGANSPTPRLIRLRDLQASGDFGQFADQNLLGYDGNTQTVQGVTVGSGLHFDPSTRILTATVSSAPTIYLSGTDSGTSGTNYILTSGNLNANSNACPVSLTTGVTATIIPAHANSSTTPTFQLCGLSSAATIVKGTSSGQTALVNNDMLTTLPARLQYDATSANWILQNPLQGGAGVTSITADGALYTNSLSSGAVTLTLGNAAAHKYWGNNTGTTGAPSYSSLVAADIPAALSSTTSVNGTTIPASATLTQTIVAPTAIALGTSAISSGTCATTVTASASGVATTDVIKCGFNGDPTAVTGYGVSGSSAVLTIYPYPTANTINIKVCNSTAGSITPGSLTLNCQVVR